MADRPEKAALAVVSRSFDDDDDDGSAKSEVGEVDARRTQA